MIWINLSLGVVLGFLIVCFIFRIVLTWYPQVELKKFPWSLIALPTEIVLAPTRRIVKPLGGVDISPIIWVGIIALIRELLLGQQGLLRML